MENCELCLNDGGLVLWRESLCRVIRVQTPEVSDYPGFLRVVLARHASEMSDLAAAERDRLMQVVYACERTLRGLYAPDKINLASLGNAVPHLHWHVIARFRDDRHFPDSVWSAPRRAPRAAGSAVSDAALAARLNTEIPMRPEIP